MANEPFFGDIQVPLTTDPTNRLLNDPSWLVLERSGVDPAKLYKMYMASTLMRLIDHKMNKRDLRAESAIFAANDQIKVGFDRRANVDIFFMGTRTLLMIDFDDANPWGLTRLDFIHLLDSLSKDGYTFALHATDRGMHAFCVSHHLSISNSEVYRLMRCGASDPFYILFTLSQGWRIRVAPKAVNLDDRVAWAVSDLGSLLGADEKLLPGRFNELCGTWVIGGAKILSEQGAIVRSIVALAEMFIALYKRLKVEAGWFATVATNKPLLLEITTEVQRILIEHKIDIPDPKKYPSGMLLLTAARPKEAPPIFTAPMLPLPQEAVTVISGEVDVATLLKRVKAM